MVRQVDNDIITAEEKAAFGDDLAQFLGDTQARTMVNYHSTGTITPNRETGALVEASHTDLPGLEALRVEPTLEQMEDMRVVGASEAYILQLTDLSTVTPDTRDYLTLEGDTLTTNGGFDSDTGWTKGSGWTIANGVATKAAGLAANLYQAITVSSGGVYQVIFTISGYSAGTLTPDLGGTNGTGRTADGTYVENITCGSGNARITFEAGNTFAGSIDDVQVILIRKHVKKIIYPMPYVYYKFYTGDKGN
jgi:hypothetical protein